MENNLIHAIVYTDIHDKLGPTPIYWYPPDLLEDIRMLVGIKTVTILSGDQGIVPDSLLIIPFPSLKLKGLIKFIEREDTKKRGGYARSVITFLFKEADDIIFYKYMNYLNSPFNETIRKMKELERQNLPNERIFEEIKQLRDDICKMLIDFRTKELSPQSVEEFPEEKRKRDKIVDYRFKMVIVGDPGVGKTSIVLRFTDNAFLRTYVPTMGVNITEKSLKVKNRIINMILWDIAGQSKFETIRQYFYQGSEAILLIFDLTNPISFRNVQNWYNDITKQGDQLIGYIFGNKSDLTKERKVKLEDALKLAKELKLNYIETSALTGKNIENAFFSIAKEVIKMKKKVEQNGY